MRENWIRNRGLGFNLYIDNEEQSFQTIDDADFLIKKRYYIAKADFPYTYRSILAHPPNCKTCESNL